MVKKIGERCQIDLTIRKKGSAAIPFANERNQGQEEVPITLKEDWPHGTSYPLSSENKKGLFKIYLRRKLSMPRDLHFYNGIEVFGMKA